MNFVKINIIWNIRHNISRWILLFEWITLYCTTSVLVKRTQIFIPLLENQYALDLTKMDPVQNILYISQLKNVQALSSQNLGENMHSVRNQAHSFILISTIERFTWEVHWA